MIPLVHTKENYPVSFLDFDSMSPAIMIWNCFTGITFFCNKLKQFELNN